MGTDEKPFFADGSIVGDYTPLFKYWGIVKGKDKKRFDAAFLTPEDFDTVKEIVEAKGKISIAEVLEELRKRFINRIDPEAAVEALREAYGATVDAETAVDRIAFIMAGWLLEAARSTGIINYSEVPSK